MCRVFITSDFSRHCFGIKVERNNVLLLLKLFVAQKCLKYVVTIEINVSHLKADSDFAW